MKKIAILLALCLFQIGFSQSADRRVFLEGHAGVGSLKSSGAVMLGVGVNYLFNRNLIGLNYNYAFTKTLGAWLFKESKTQVDELSLTYGRTWDLAENVMLSASGGIASDWYTYRFYDTDDGETLTEKQSYIGFPFDVSFRFYKKNRPNFFAVKTGATLSRNNFAYVGWPTALVRPEK